MVNPFRTADSLSQSGTTAFATVTYTVMADELIDASKAALRAAVERARDAGPTVEVGGTALASQPSAGGAGEVIGIAIAAVVAGFRYSTQVVVAAALIMIAVFSGFITAGESMIKRVGFGLAIAVLFRRVRRPAGLRTCRAGAGR